MYVCYIVFSAFSIQSKNYPTYYFGPADNGLDYKIVQNSHTKFIMVSPGLTGEVGTVSFQPIDSPGHYLRLYNFLLVLEKRDGNDGMPADMFDLDATFRMRENKFFSGFFSFESVKYRNYYIRHQGFSLKVSQEDHSDLYQNDASFKIISTGMFPNLIIIFNIKRVISITREVNGEWGRVIRNNILHIFPRPSIVTAFLHIHNSFYTFTTHYFNCMLITKICKLIKCHCEAESLASCSTQLLVGTSKRFGGESH